MRVRFTQKFAMKNFKPFLSSLIIFSLPLGCISSSTTEPVFPEDQTPAIISANDFDRIWDNLDGYKNKTVKIAGRIVDTSSTPEGAVILATWIPYVPHFDLEDGPPDTAPELSRNFAFLFPGIAGDPFAKGPDYDPLVAWEGNKFVLEGTVKGSRKMLLSVVGEEKTMLFIKAQCIHVWETGESEATSQPDSQWAGQIARTFCVRKNR